MTHFQESSLDDKIIRIKYGIPDKYNMEDGYVKVPIYEYADHFKKKDIENQTETETEDLDEAFSYIALQIYNKLISVIFTLGILTSLFSLLFIVIYGLIYANLHMIAAVVFVVAVLITSGVSILPYDHKSIQTIIKYICLKRSV